jgi:hypothetical protein
MPLSTNLPVAIGGIGATQDTQNLAAFKTVVVNGLSGTIVIEASGDGVNFNTAVSFISGQEAGQKSITVSARAMRVDATDGSASSVEVIAEGSLARNAVVPTPPADGPGAALDISSFGSLSTIFVTNHPQRGSINIEVSANGVDWATAFKTFAGSGLFTEKITARFVRAVGRGASADVAIASEESLSTALTSPSDGFVLQASPGGTQGGNVYLDVNFASLIDAMNQVEGWKTIFVDDRFGTPVLPAEVFQLPQFTILSALGPKDGGPPRTFLEIPEGCQLLGLRFITGALYLDCQNTLTPIVPGPDFVDNPNPGRIMIGGLGPKNGPRTQLDANGGAPIFELPDDSFIQVFFHGQAGVSGNPIFSLGENAFLLIRALPDTILADNLASGPASSAYSVGLQAGASVTADPAGAFGGTFSLDNFGPAGIHTFGNESILNTVDTRYLNESAGPAIAGTVARRGAFSRDGIVRNLTAYHNLPVGNAQPVVYTLEINGAPTAVTASLAADANGPASNVTDFVVVSPGDTYALTATKGADIADGALAPSASFEYFAVVEFP